MPLLEVSIDGLFDPMFSDLFTVRRRTEQVSGTGRSQVTSVSIPNVVGVVTMASGKDLERLPEAEIFERVISVVTAFKLQGETLGKQPDLVLWRGGVYVVKAIDLYPQFGQGLFEAICTSMDLVDQSYGGGGYQFNQQQNALYLGVQ